MTRALMLAGLVAVFASPALASSSQLARAAGVEPGLYSTHQLVQLLSLRNEGGNDAAVARILSNPRGAPLVGRLSTTTHEPATD